MTPDHAQSIYAEIIRYLDKLHNLRLALLIRGLGLGET